MQPAIGEIEPRLGDAGQLFHRAFDARDAGAAGDALDREIHAERAVAGGLGVVREVERFAHGHFMASLQRHPAARAEHALAVAVEIDDQLPLAGLALAGAVEAAGAVGAERNDMVEPGIGRMRERGIGG